MHVTLYVTFVEKQVNSTFSSIALQVRTVLKVTKNHSGSAALLYNY